METSWQLQLDPHVGDSPWSRLSRHMGGEVRVLALFGVLHLLLVVLGEQYRAPAEGFIIIWPAVGLLFLALWLAERRYWTWIVLIQLATELLVAVWQPGHFSGASFREPFLHAVVGLVSALAIRRMLSGQQGLRLVAVLLFMAAGAIGASVGALLWIGIALAARDGSDLVHHVLLFWFADLMGMVVALPPAMGWLVAWRFRRLFSLATIAQRVEVAVLLIFQVVVSAIVFSANGAGAFEQLRFPVLVVPGLIYSAFRFPPRWSTVLMSTTILVVFWLIVHGGNPLGIDRTIDRFIWIQVGGATFLMAAISLTVFVAQSRLALAGLAASEARYRSFIEMSSEAVWRIEVMPPMPIDLPLAGQLDWLRRNTHLAESSESFARLAGGTREAASGGWAADVPWVRLFEAGLEQIQSQGYRASDLRFTVQVEGRARTFLTSFNGVVRDGRLERIWGVARDVTELLELNARLLREQELLRSYARRIVTAEESTRHSTASDLHSGISQELAAMGMMLTSLGTQLAPEQRARLDELRGHLHRVQQSTRDMISDLSPPGLYDLGLVPALQWLVVYLRGRDRLRVELDAQVDELAIPVDLRVTVFKMVRELLRNVVKHAAVDTAMVRLRGDRTRLVVEVRDQGGGFGWHADYLVSPQRGFGLWSIGGRVAELGGRFSVESTPGRGAVFTLEIPLRGG
jgi:signal transduction histidine kinase